MQRRADRATPNLSRAGPRETRMKVSGTASLGLLLSILSGLLPATAFAVQRWDQYYGGYHIRAEGYSVRQTRDGGYVVAGTWHQRAALLKIDSLGDTLWLQTYLPPDGDLAYFYSVLQTPDGGYLATGDCFIPRTTRGEWLYVVKTDSLGDSVCARTYRRYDCRSMGFDIAPTRDGGYMVFGGQEDSALTVALAYFVRMDSLGETLWTRTVNAPTSFGYGYGAVKQTSDGGFIVFTNTYPGGVSYNTGCLLRLDSLGYLMWSRLYGDNGATPHQFEAGDIMPDGGFIAAGRSLHRDITGDAWLVRTDKNGETLWTRYYGNMGTTEGIIGLCRNGRGGFVGVGTYGISMSEGHLYMLSVAENGDFEWSRTFGRPGCQLGEAVAQTSDGGYIATGYECGYSMIYVVKTDATGSAGIQLEPEQRPEPATGLRLLPAIRRDSEHKLRYFIPASSPVTIHVYDNTGRSLALVSEGMVLAGWHEAALPRALPAGVYFARLDACGQRASAKLVRTD